MRAQLIPLDGTVPIDIKRDLTLVGRREDCDVCLNHKSVSKIHCVIVRTDGLLLLRDLGSTNGTRVNGQRVRRAALLPNDQIGIAGFKFKVHLGPDVQQPEERPQEHTQRLDANEVAGLIKREHGEQILQDSAHLSGRPVHTNQLPDVYPEDSQVSA